MDAFDELDWRGCMIDGACIMFLEKEHFFALHRMKLVRMASFVLLFRPRIHIGFCIVVVVFQIQYTSGTVTCSDEPDLGFTIDFERVLVFSYR